MKKSLRSKKRLLSQVLLYFEEEEVALAGVRLKAAVIFNPVSRRKRTFLQTTETLYVNVSSFTVAVAGSRVGQNIGLCFPCITPSF